MPGENIDGLEMTIDRRGRPVPVLWESKEESDRIRRDITIGTDEFAVMVTEALERKTPLSVVRMADGEDEIILYCKARAPEDLMEIYIETWRTRLGVQGITCGEMWRRLDYAATQTLLFSPDGERWYMRAHWPMREKLIEIYYPYRTPVAVKRRWFQIAGHVLIINGYQKYVDMIRKNLPEGVKLSHISIRNWRETDRVIAEAAKNDAPLVLFSAGPAGKCIARPLSDQGKVVLDVGDGMGSWWWEKGKGPNGETMDTEGNIIQPRHK